MLGYLRRCWATYAGVGQAYPAGHIVQFCWFIFPSVVWPSRHGIGKCALLGHMNPAEQLLQTASPFNEYVPVEQAPLNNNGDGQELPAGHGEQKAIP